MKTYKKLIACAGLLLSAAAVQASEGLYEVEVTGLQGLNILEGSTVWQPKPLYPTMALRRRLEGTVLVEYTINANGKAKDINILEASPRGFFDNATVRALESATFGVSYHQGEPVDVTGVKKRFIYKIEKDDAGNGRSVVAIN